MNKPKSPPYWVRNLRSLMEAKNLNPRRLSLNSGLNATAVRDMLEGRTRFPRYDTALALSTTLGTTPAHLMGERGRGDELGADVELLAEIITRLLEVADENKHRPKPREFAAMAATAYHKLIESGEQHKGRAIGAQVHEIFDYEMLRKKSARR